MKTLLSRIKSDLKSSSTTKANSGNISTLRLLLRKIQAAADRKGRDLADDEVTTVILKQLQKAEKQAVILKTYLQLVHVPGNTPRIRTHLEYCIGVADENLVILGLLHGPFPSLADALVESGYSSSDQQQVVIQYNLDGTEEVIRVWNNECADWLGKIKMSYENSR